MIIGPEHDKNMIPCANPHAKRNAAKMQKRGAEWVHISKEPLWYESANTGRPEFRFFTEGKTYFRKDPKPLTKKERRRIAKQKAV